VYMCECVSMQVRVRVCVCECVRVCACVHIFNNNFTDYRLKKTERGGRTQQKSSQTCKKTSKESDIK